MSGDDYSAHALRRGTWHFLTGKLLSAPLAFVALLWAVRLLPVEEYTTYVTMFASVEFCLVVGSFGLPWMASRYLPELNLQARSTALRRLCLRLLAAQLTALVLMGALLSGASVLVGPAVGMTTTNLTLALLCAMLLAEGLGRFVRDSLLAPLMLQRAVRASLVLRQSLLVLGIAGMAIGDLRSALILFGVECLASAASTLLALRALWLRLNDGASPVGAEQTDADNATGDSRPQWGVALRMYGAHLCSLAYSPLVLLHVVQRLAGAEAAALFGFLRLVHDQVARYLPAMLLFSLIRPKLMAGFVQAGLPELFRNANLSGKLSLFVLGPVAAFVTVTGDACVQVLASGRFPDSGWVLLGFILVLVPYSQRQLLESVAVAAGLSRHCLAASALSMIALPVTIGLWPGPFGVATAIATMLIGHLLFDGLLSLALHRSIGYRSDARGLRKLALATLLAVAAGWAMSTLGSGVGGALASGAASVAVFLGTAWWIKPFSAEERGRINGLARRKVFIW